LNFEKFYLGSSFGNKTNPFSFDPFVVPARKKKRKRKKEKKNVLEGLVSRIYGEQLDVPLLLCSTCQEKRRETRTTKQKCLGIRVEDLVQATCRALCSACE